MFKRALVATAIALAGISAQAATLVSEGFESVTGLTAKGWVLTNASTPLGVVTEGFFQGDVSAFTSQAGVSESYAAADFNGAAAGGTLATYLISPTFSTAYAGVVTFWAKSLAGNYTDYLSWGMSTGSSATSAFTLTTPTLISGAWTQYSFAFGAQAPGSVARFAIEYVGSADLANYVGIDTFAVVNTVPEPSTYLMFGAGLLALAYRGRRAVTKR